MRHSLAVAAIAILVTCASSSTLLVEPHKPVCSDYSSHTKGGWVLRGQQQPRPAKSFVCEDRSAYCASSPLEKLRYGPDESRWGNPAHLHSGNRTFTTCAASRGCSCDNITYTTESAANRGSYISTREMYVWRADSCSLLLWNATLFCSLLGNRVVFLTGDSTMEQTANSLMNMITYGGGNCSEQIVFGISYLLVIHGGAHIRFFDHLLEHKYRGQTFMPDFIIMTVGAHLQDMGDINAIWSSLVGGPDPYNINHLRDPKQRYIGRKIVPKLVWKTQNPGHIGCQNSSYPLINISQYRRDDDEFNWAIHLEFDEYSKRMCALHNISVIDMSPLYLRPDAHPGKNMLLLNKKSSHDCLHYCTPGPVDLFGNILLTQFYTKML